MAALNGFEEREMIDCDVHNTWNSAVELLPFMDPNFRDYLLRGELPGPRGAFPHAHRPWLHPEGFMRTDLTDDGNPGANWEVMREKLLDRYDLDYVILLGEEAIEVSTLANPFYAMALAKAYNNYLIDIWLPRDPRLKGAMVIAPQDAEGAAAEIRRVAEHTLLYCSDYPHWDFDDPGQIPLPEPWRERIFDTNARELYGLPPKV
jgi:predicted TIM-barrel fold metal-dependent hydrolase